MYGVACGEENVLDRSPHTPPPPPENLSVRMWRHNDNEKYFITARLKQQTRPLFNLPVGLERVGEKTVVYFDDDDDSDGSGGDDDDDNDDNDNYL